MTSEYNDKYETGTHRAVAETSVLVRPQDLIRYYSPVNDNQDAFIIGVIHGYVVMPGEKQKLAIHVRYVQTDGSNEMDIPLDTAMSQCRKYDTGQNIEFLVSVVESDSASGLPSGGWVFVEQFESDGKQMVKVKRPGVKVDDQENLIDVPLEKVMVLK